MILTIHQPQYIPWLPYILKIKKSEVFILLDSVSFQKNGLQNRNKIKTAQGSSWLTVPIIRNSGQKIIDTKINNSTDWKKKHWNTLLQNYNSSPYFHHYIKEIEEIYQYDWEYLSELNKAFLELILKWMNIKTKIILSSNLKSSGKGSELILNICKELGATKYISGMGGRNYLELDSFESEGIDIQFSEAKLAKNHYQNHASIGFLNDLSVIDLIFNCGNKWNDYTI